MDSRSGFAEKLVFTSFITIGRMIVTKALTMAHSISLSLVDQESELAVARI
jgi:hypothetical protein